VDAQDTLSEAGSEAGDGGDEAIAEPGESSSTSRRARIFLAVLFWFEGAWAASFFGWTIAYWAALPGAYARDFFQDLHATHLLVRTTDVPRLCAYLAFIALVAIVLTVAGFAVWRARSNPSRAAGLILGRGVLWSQPLLIVLMVVSALAAEYGWNLGALVLAPSFPEIAIIAMVLFIAVVTFLLGKTHPFLLGSFPATGRFLSAGVTVLIVVMALVPLFLVDGFLGSERAFSSVGVLPTGQSVQVEAVDCALPSHCVAAGTNLGNFVGLPLRYVAIGGFIGSNGRWETTPLPPPEPNPPAKSIVELLGDVGTSVSVACPTADRCLAIGLWSVSPPGKLSLPVWRSDDGGKRWVLMKAGFPGGAGLVHRSLGCMNASDCVASNGQVVIATRDGGIHWKVVANLAASQLQNPAGAVACATSRGCVVVVSAEEAVNLRGTKFRRLTMVTWTSDAGLVWKSRSATGLQALPEAFACWSPTDCLLSGNPVDPSAPAPVASLYLTRDRGLRWERLAVPGGPQGPGLVQMQCVASNECLATTGRSVIRTTDGGMTWTTLLQVSGSNVRVLSCSTPDSCVAGGSVNWTSDQSAALWTTQDGGRSWTSQPFPRMPVPRDLRPCPVFSNRCGTGWVRKRSLRRPVASPL
jgi:photosystem II stability/assembly factor-like uncharacterized protein